MAQTIGIQAFYLWKVRENQRYCVGDAGVKDYSYKKKNLQLEYGGLLALRCLED